MSVCLCALVSLCKDQTEDRCSSRGEEEEEEDRPVLALVPDASFPQQRPADDTDASANNLQVLDEVIHMKMKQLLSTIFHKYTVFLLV